MQTPGVSNHSPRIPAKDLANSPETMANTVKITVFVCGVLKTGIAAIAAWIILGFPCALMGPDSSAAACTNFALTSTLAIMLGGLALSAAAAYGAGKVTAAVLQQSQSPATLEGRVSV